MEELPDKKPSVSGEPEDPMTTVQKEIQDATTFDEAYNAADNAVRKLKGEKP
jgi:hypothetical protein